MQYTLHTISCDYDDDEEVIETPCDGMECHEIPFLKTTLLEQQQQQRQKSCIV